LFISGFFSYIVLALAIVVIIGEKAIFLTVERGVIENFEKSSHSL